MIDSRKPPPILKCPTCKTLYGPNMTKCSRCGGPLVVAPGPTRLAFVAHDLPAGRYRPGQSFTLGPPRFVDL